MFGNDMNPDALFEADALLEEMAKVIEKMLESSAFARFSTAVTKMFKMRFDELVEAGFTREEAIQIMSHQEGFTGIPK